MNVDIKKVKNTIVISVNFDTWLPGMPKVRVYENVARGLVMKDMPSVKLGKCLKGGVARSVEKDSGAEWVFEVVEEKKKKKTNKTKMPKMPQVEETEEIKTSEEDV